MQISILLEVSAVANFSLLWNLFESKLGNNNMDIALIGNISRQISEKPTCGTFYQEYLRLF